MRYTTAGLWLMVAACGGSQSEAPGTQSVDASLEMEEAEAAPEGYAIEQQRAQDDDVFALGGAAAVDPGLALMRSRGEAPDAPPPPPPSSNADVVSEDDVRRWFPETFLWEPLVETGDDGLAEVDVVIPDQLTTWRMLALAHDRRGEQAGTVRTVDSALDVYVDPVTPGWLYAGDQVDLRVQVSNTSDRVFAETLQLTTNGPLSGSGADTVRLEPGSTVVRSLPVQTTGAGEALVRTDYGSLDAAERRIPVLATGRPVTQQRGGTVSDTRVVRTTASEDTDASTDVLSISVFPGPLAVLQSELERVDGLSREPGTAAFGYAIASRLQDIATALGQPLDDAVVRRMRLTTHQRVMWAASHSTTEQQSWMLMAMTDLPDDSASDPIRDRMVERIVSAQRGDGTWAWSERGSIQQMLVQTALVMHVLPDDEDTALRRAEGAMERFVGEVDDAYTAAVLVATGAVSGDARDALMELVRDGLVERDGVRTVRVPDDVASPWTRQPTRVEMLAWTVLAFLAVDEPDMAGSLTGELMTGYDAARGFGAGAADLLALDAVLGTITPLDQPVTVRAMRDGQVLAQAPLDPAQPMQPASLEVPMGASSDGVTLEVDPPVAGLSFVAVRRSWVPWTGDETHPGLQLEVAMPEWRMGNQSDMTLTLAGASRQRYRVELGLPAGALVDETALGALRSEFDDVEVHTDRVVLTTKPFRPSQVVEVAIPIRPAFAGTFSTLPVRVSNPDRPWEAATALRPQQWVVR